MRYRYLSYRSRPLSNNSIISSYVYSSGWSSRQLMEFYCCSNSTNSGNTGLFIGLNDTYYSGRIGVTRYSSSSSYAGCMYIRLYSSIAQRTSEQGIYTCRMLDSAGRNIDVSVGIYRNDYTSEFSLLYTSKLVQYIHTCSHMHAVTCMQFTGLTSVASMYDQYEW